ncbi:hypothetical protein ACO2Q3_00310 [Caulobacter sp. KR2-114]|uniref:hypothetical protein n=1 Tax=Caulobacter sp. KR2-114 TaxID=3400912 RepID=UPI003C010357
MARLAIGVGLALAAAATAALAAPEAYIVHMPGYQPPDTHRAPRPPVSEDLQRDLARPALVADGSAPAVQSGALSKGQAVLTVGVLHGLTATLDEAMSTGGWRPVRIAAGSPLFGTPMGGPDGPTLAWCAPQRQPDANGAPHWRTFCLPFGEKGFVWVEAKPALMPLTLAWMDGVARDAPAPKVTRGTAALPAMKLAYVFGGWDKRGWMLLQETLDWGEGPQPLRAIALPPGGNGAVTVKLMGGEIALRQASASRPEAAVADVLAPPRADAPIVF